MSQGEEEVVEKKQDDNELDFYGDTGIASCDAKIPKFLIFTYIFWPLWGIATFFYFWNGSLVGWMDPGYWHELQVAANTTFPIENQNMLPQNQALEEPNSQTIDTK